MLSFILYIVSSVLKLALGVVGGIYGFFASIIKREFDIYYMDLAVAKDQYGNALLRYLFNDFLRKKNGYRFGNIDETISSALGKNHAAGTLTWLGRLLDNILNAFEKEHSIKSIDKTIKN